MQIFSLTEKNFSMSICIENSSQYTRSTTTGATFADVLNCEEPTLITDKDSMQIQNIIAKAMAYPMGKVVKHYMRESTISAPRLRLHVKGNLNGFLPFVQFSMTPSVCVEV
ncbi:hypothetical protein Brsp01_34620 [Brucella sp. NBRC 12950]|nr:hypothetical protein Brsp01_34620 [Brucella sp. NBRC 12950]